MALRKQ